MPYIIVKRYQHFNRSLNKWIGSRKQYEQEMIKGGYVDFDKAEQLSEAVRQRNTKKYDGLSDKTMKFIYQVKDMANKDGTIPVTDRYVQGLKDNGVRLDVLPKHYRVDQGGFE